TRQWCRTPGATRKNVPASKACSPALLARTIGPCRQPCSATHGWLWLPVTVPAGRGLEGRKTNGFRVGRKQVRWLSPCCGWIRAAGKSKASGGGQTARADGDFMACLNVKAFGPFWHGRRERMGYPETTASGHGWQPVAVEALPCSCSAEVPS